MGLLAPGLLRIGDIPQLAALSTPRRLIVAGGRNAQGKELHGENLSEAYAFTTKIYRLAKQERQLKLLEDATAVPGAIDAG